MLRKAIFTTIMLMVCAHGSSSNSGVPYAAQTKAHEPSSSAVAVSDFARSIELLSETGGYFDTDNLISNEASYLHVLGKMREMRITGGAYIGVGPDQNYSYIAQIRPKVAYLVDIRRDNLLQHLFFKSLFALSGRRIDYLCLLLGKPIPKDAAKWGASNNVQELIEYIERTPINEKIFEISHASIRAKALSFRIPLSATDLAKIRSIHAEFFNAGLDLRFTTLRRAARSYYPSYRDLILEKDLSGRLGNYLAREDDFQFLKSLHGQNLIIPVVGDLAGEHALQEVARVLTNRGERISAFYVSNVEYYLMANGKLERFIKNLKQLPHDDRSLIIRSYFGGVYGAKHPQAVDGYYSSQLLQTINSMLEEHQKGGLESYYDLVTKHSISLR
ncbi:MAG: hypothetical protein WKF84_00795 [Pyrinomonadaceae bacterium]